MVILDLDFYNAASLRFLSLDCASCVDSESYLLVLRTTRPLGNAGNIFGKDCEISFSMSFSTYWVHLTGKSCF